jgi:hypothetical protein
MLVHCAGLPLPAAWLPPPSMTPTTARLRVLGCPLVSFWFRECATHL